MRPAGALSFPCGDIAALADAMHRLAEDQTLRDGLASAAFSRAATQTEQVFAEITESAVVDMMLPASPRRSQPVTARVHDGAKRGGHGVHNEATSHERMR